MNELQFEEDVETGGGQYFSLDMFLSIHKQSTRKKFSVFHLNIRSFQRNSDEFNILLEQLAVRPSVVVLTETWFTTQYTGDLEGYDAYHTFREDKRGGGVSVYVRKGFKHKSIERWSYNGENMEICSVEISLPTSRVVVHGIYRAPDRSIPMFNDEITELFAGVNRNDHVFVTGDMNLDLVDPSLDVCDFVNICRSSSFLPLIGIPTHVTPNRASCLDHLWYNQLCDVNSGVFKIDITDHYPIFAVIPIFAGADHFFTKRFRDHSQGSLSKLKNAISVFSDEFAINLNSHSPDVNALTEAFHDQFFLIYDRCCPIRCKQVSSNGYMKPWINNEVLNCVIRKHELFREYKRGLVSFQVYNSHKNLVTRTLRRVKSEYFKNKFNSNMNNARGTWRTLNSIMGKTPKSGRPTEMVDAARTITEPSEIADCLNTYFSGVAANLDRVIPNADISPLDCMAERISSSFFVRPVGVNDVVRIIKSLKLKSCNFTSIPNIAFKCCIDSISSVIAKLFNMSISSGIFPDCLKVARVIPIHKSGSKSLPSNYRPISTLSVLSKCFEKLMHRQLIGFIHSNDILSRYQFGFKENAGTSDAILEFLDNAYNALDHKQSIISVFLDLSKAFDTVSHDILLQKLDVLGVRGIVLDWFGSYLCGRTQYVDVDGYCSGVTCVNAGVPQGSVLGPTLFLLYINDMHRCSEKLNFIHFADDTTVFRSSTDIDDLAVVMNSELGNVVQWLHANRLSLNIAKTSYMVISDGLNRDVPVIRVDDRNVDHVDNAKFLGVIIDDKLNFKRHVNDLARKLSRSIGMMNRISYFVPPFAKRKIFYSLVYSRMSYGLLAWGMSSARTKNTMERLIRKCRGIVEYPVTVGSDAAATILNFDLMYKYSASVKLYRVVKMDQHQYFLTIFNSLLPNHNHQTRFSVLDTFNVPYTCKAKCQKKFLFQSVGIWNSLPGYVKEARSLSSFKKMLKRELLGDR